MRLVCLFIVLIFVLESLSDPFILPPFDCARVNVAFCCTSRIRSLCPAECGGVQCAPAFYHALFSHDGSDSLPVPPLPRISIDQLPPQEWSFQNGRFREEVPGSRPLLIPGTISARDGDATILSPERASPSVPTPSPYFNGRHPSTAYPTLIPEGMISTTAGPSTTSTVVSSTQAPTTMSTVARTTVGSTATTTAQVAAVATHEVQTDKPRRRVTTPDPRIIKPPSELLIIGELDEDEPPDTVPASVIPSMPEAPLMESTTLLPTTSQRTTTTVIGGNNLYPLRRSLMSVPHLRYLASLNSSPNSPSGIPVDVLPHLHNNTRRRRRYQQVLDRRFVSPHEHVMYSTKQVVIPMIPANIYPMHGQVTLSPEQAFFEDQPVKEAQTRNEGRGSFKRFKDYDKMRKAGWTKGERAGNSYGLRRVRKMDRPRDFVRRVEGREWRESLPKWHSAILPHTAGSVGLGPRVTGAEKKIKLFSVDGSAMRPRPEPFMSSIDEAGHSEDKFSLALNGEDRDKPGHQPSLSFNIRPRLSKTDSSTFDGDTPAFIAPAQHAVSHFGQTPTSTVRPPTTVLPARPTPTIPDRVAPIIPITPFTLPPPLPPSSTYAPLPQTPSHLPHPSLPPAVAPPLQCGIAPQFTPCLTAAKASEKLLSCCRAKGLPPGCQDLCRYDITQAEVKAAMDAGRCGLLSVQPYLECASQGQDNTECCRHRGIAAKSGPQCEDLCRSTQFKPLGLQHIVCGSVIRDLLQCHHSGVKQ